MSGAKRVYFLRPVGQPGPVKIGCSEWPENRLQPMMGWSPFPLEIAASTPGTHADETCLHSMFAADHSHAEWFRASERLTTLITAVADGAPLADLLDGSVARVNFRDHSTQADPEWRLWNRYNHRVRRAFQKLRTDDAIYSAPGEVRWILKNWRGRDTEEGLSRPTAEEIAYLETILDNPAAHAEETRWPRKATPQSSAAA